MKIGLLGGAFNPPHIGHYFIARQVLDFTDCEQIWFVPCYKHTFEKPTIPVEHRVSMTRLFVEQLATKQNMAVSTLEIDHQLDGNTINLIPHLPAEHTYRFIIGSDNLPTFHLWGDWEKLLKELSFLVFPRYGYPNEPLYEGMSMVNDASLVVSNTSSTKIRERAGRGLSIAEFVPGEVEKYIGKENLYK